VAGYANPTACKTLLVKPGIAPAAFLLVFHRFHAHSGVKENKQSV